MGMLASHWRYQVQDVGNWASTELSCYRGVRLVLREPGRAEI